ncbi:MAG: dihydrodipicolinate synthase family protein [Pseudomonadota bacterium]
MSNNWRGLLAILVTPFGEDDAVIMEDLDRQIEFCIASGTQAIAAPLLASEFYKLTDEERVAYFQRVSATTRGRAPFLAGVSGTSPAHAVFMARAAKDAGADGLIAMPPYVGRSTAVSTAAYYNRVLTATDLPVMVQNAQAPFGIPLTAQALVDLVDRYPNVAAIKEETEPNPQSIGRVVDALGDRPHTVFGGHGGLNLMNELGHGSSGTMPACEFADVVAQVLAYYDAGDIEECRGLFSLLQPMLVMERLYGMRFAKYCLKKRGVISTTNCRDAFPVLDEKDVAEIEALWEPLSGYFRT